LRLNTGRISVMMPKNGKAMMYTSGCPKNQNRCCHRIGPPLTGSNTCAPNSRSASSDSSAPARIGKAISTSRLVTSVFQVKIGIRNIVIPGARMQMMVVTKLTAPRIVPRPAIHRPITHRSPPTPGLRTASESGVYAVQPKSAAPWGVRNPDAAISPPKRNSQ
jgi:hypothetical protein